MRLTPGAEAPSFPATAGLPEGRPARTLIQRTGSHLLTQCRRAISPLDLFLPLRTAMAAAADNDHSLDGSLAYQARFACAAVHAMLQLKNTFLPVGIDIVGNR